MTDKTRKDSDLDELFAQMRDTPVDPPSEDLMARIMADAAAEMPRRVGTQAAVSGWRMWWAVLGGWQGASGMGLAALTGLWLGVAQPAALADLSESILGGGTPVSLGLASDFWAEEG